MESNFIAGAYIRLSKKDQKNDVSNSIENQKSLINNFLNNNKDIKLHKFYIDDGYSGTDFIRPSFFDLLNDINDHKINSIILKDLSRFGRSHVESSYYLEMVFPFMNVRVISLNESIDNINELDTDEFTKIALLNLAHDEHARDISKKTRSSLKSKRDKGLYAAGLTPYGYIKNKYDKYTINIDPEPAKIIKKIFNLAESGKSKHEIVNYLNKKNVLTPSEHRNSIKQNDRLLSDEWSIKKLDLIFKNRIYAGDLVQGKTRTASYRVHKRIPNKEENININEDNHKAIVSKEQFNLVNDLMYNRKRKVRKDYSFDTFSGFIKCYDCNKNMTLKRYTKYNKTYHYYECSSYYRKKECSSKKIEYSLIENEVLKVLGKNNIFIKKLTHKEVIKYINNIIIKEDKIIKVIFN